MKTKHNGLTLISLIAAIAGVIVSFSLLKEDVLSTAKTLFEYFPANFGVQPAMTWTGAIYLGIFVSVTQVVSASVASRKELSKAVRWTAGILLVLTIPFDAWTDIVFRSGNFTGDPLVAIVTTIAFYTFGSEIMQSLSWLIILTSWRQGVRELMWFAAKGIEGFKSIKTEWPTIRRNTRNQEMRDVERMSSTTPAPPSTVNPYLVPGSNIQRPATRPRPANPPYNEPTYHSVNPTDGE